MSPRNSLQCALSADGTYLLTGQHSGAVALLRKRNGRFVPHSAEKLPRHDGQVRSIEFLPGRSAFITAGSEGTIRFFSSENRAVIAEMRVPAERLTSLEVSPDGSFMAAGDSDSSMTLWDLRAMDAPLLMTRPLGCASLNDLPAVSSLAGEVSLPSNVRRSLQFVEHVLRHRFRHDIEIQEFPEIHIGEFDIEID